MQKRKAVNAHPAAIAQLVEHFIRNEKVVGSSPPRGSRDKKLIVRRLNVDCCQLSVLMQAWIPRRIAVV